MPLEPHAVGDFLLSYSINWLWLASSDALKHFFNTIIFNFSESQEFRDLEFESQDSTAMVSFASALSVYQRLAEWQQTLRLFRQLDCMEVRVVKSPTNHSECQLSRCYHRIPIETQVLWTPKTVAQKYLHSHHSLWPLLSWKWERCKTCSAFCKKFLPRYTTKNMPTYLHTNTFIYLHTLMHRHIDTVMYHLLFKQVSGCNFGAFLLGPSLQSVALVLVFDEDCDASSGTGRSCQQAGLKGFLKH